MFGVRVRHMQQRRQVRSSNDDENDAAWAGRDGTGVPVPSAAHHTHSTSGGRLWRGKLDDDTCGAANILVEAGKLH